MVTMIDENSLNQAEALQSATKGNLAQQKVAEFWVVGIGVPYPTTTLFVPTNVALEDLQVLLSKCLIAHSTKADGNKVASRHNWDAKYLTTPEVSIKKREVFFFDRDVWVESNVPLDLQGTPVATWKP